MQLMCEVHDFVQLLAWVAFMLILWWWLGKNLKPPRDGTNGGY